MAIIAWRSVEGEGVHERKHQQLEVSELWEDQLAIPGEVLQLSVPAGSVGQVDEQPQPIQPVPTVAAEPEPAYLPTEQAAEVEGAEAIICSIFTDDCNKALRVAQCESGPDYYAPIGYVYSGTYQEDSGHAGRYEAHGWNYWTDSDNIYKNTVIAKEARDERQDGSWIGGLWPVCGYS